METLYCFTCFGVPYLINLRFKRRPSLELRRLFFVSYWTILTLGNSLQFEFQRRVNKRYANVPFASRLDKQEVKPGNLHQVFIARPFDPRVVLKKSEFLFLSYVNDLNSMQRKRAYSCTIKITIKPKVLLTSIKGKLHSEI